MLPNLRKYRTAATLFRLLALATLAFSLRWMWHDLGWPSMVMTAQSLFTLAGELRRNRLALFAALLLTVGSMLWFFNIQSEETIIAVLVSIINLALTAKSIKNLASDEQGLTQAKYNALLQSVEDKYIRDKLNQVEQDKFSLNAVDFDAALRGGILANGEDHHPELAGSLALARLKQHLRLLILGEAGAGKSTCLLQLARQLIEEARRHGRDHQALLSSPIPIVLNLARWSLEQKSLADWLCDELKAVYGVTSRQIQNQLINHQRPYWLLDGLDEVDQDCLADCIDAINQFCQDHHPLIVVTCRKDVYLSQTHTLKGFQAILITPLSEAQVQAYLVQSGQAGVYAALVRHKQLKALAHNPLFLKVMQFAFRGGAALDIDPTEETRAIQASLFETYIEQVFLHGERDKDLQGIRIFDRALTERSLSNIAVYLTRHNQRQLFIDRVQPDFLAGWLRREYTLIVTLLTALIGGVIGATGLGIILSGVVDYPYPFIGAIVSAVAVGTATALLAGTSVALAGSLTTLFLVWITAVTTPQLSLPLASTGAGLTVGFVAVVNKRLGYIIPASTSWLTFTLRLALGIISGGLVALTVALAGALPLSIAVTATLLFALGCAVGMATSSLLSKPIHSLLKRGHVQPAEGKYANTLEIIPREATSWSWTGATYYFSTALIVGMLIILFLGGGLSVVILVALTVGMFAGFQGYTRDPDQMLTLTPNYAIRRSAWNALKASVGGLGLGVAAAVLRQNNTDGMVFGLAMVAGAFLPYGGLAVLQHYALRLVLARHGYIPFDLVNFLEYTSALMLTRRVGGSYEFIHGLLQEHFAARG